MVQGDTRASIAAIRLCERRLVEWFACFVGRRDRSTGRSRRALAARWPARSGLAFIGAAAGYRNLISIDIGGTSADIGVIYDGAPGLTDKGHIVECPLAPPVIVLTTMGAGGGSIARYSPERALTVGPQSAGAEPGPACYGRGGAAPTVTDSHLVLGVAALPARRCLRGRPCPARPR